MGEGAAACAGCGEKTESKLSCPKCLALGLPPSIFCSQDCFKKNWAAHKVYHVAAKHVISEHGQHPTIGYASLSAGITGESPPDEWEKDGHLRRFVGYKFTGAVRPWPQTARRSVSAEEVCGGLPDYAVSGYPASEMRAKGGSGGKIRVYNPEEIARIREACLIGRQALDLAHSLIKPGVTTETIDLAVHNFILSKRAYPSPLNYFDFPKSCCTSVNEIICHGIPDLRPLVEGDIVNVDISVYLNGMHGDLNETFLCGEVDEKSRELVQTAYDSMMHAIEHCKPGVLYRRIGDLIANLVEGRRLSVVKTYCGHGIGELFHTVPNVPHYRRNKAIGEMKPGHVFTIEPMINQGNWQDKTWPDDWTSTTLDGKRSAQFEHTILITEDGYEILTKRLPTSPPLGIVEREL